ncbi:hypothetical protein TSAR_002194 [Trichomalopsis sarcophagae]|uniref:Uncharacterized protein n=1 Tax=Trichomalopsis sarcophagae TaxID=543379 RepID=A0A232FG13_9HYME|nr:hypothetical protein TSAR_002194 [Trichomalopsis sarcophagae]
MYNISSEGFRSTHVGAGKSLRSFACCITRVQAARTRGTLEECTNVSHALRSDGKLRRQVRGIFRLFDLPTNNTCDLVCFSNEKTQGLCSPLREEQEREKIERRWRRRRK